MSKGSEGYTEMTVATFFLIGFALAATGFFILTVMYEASFDNECSRLDHSVDGRIDVLKDELKSQCTLSKQSKNHDAKVWCKAGCENADYYMQQYNKVASQITKAWENVNITVNGIDDPYREYGITDLWRERIYSSCNYTCSNIRFQ